MEYKVSESLTVKDSLTLNILFESLAATIFFWCNFTLSLNFNIRYITDVHVPVFLS